MKSICSTCVQDIKRLLTNALFWVLTATLAVIVLVVNLALPKEMAPETMQELTYQAPAGLAFGTPAESEQALREAVQDGAAVGFVFAEEGVTIVHPGFSEKTLNIYQLELQYAMRGTMPAIVEVTNLDEAAKEIPFNLLFTPVFIAFEALMTGFILGGALMLAEKQDGTVRALRVSPFGAVNYVIAKTLLFSLIGTVYAALICLLTVGVSVNWALFLLLSFFGTAIFTMIGLAYTSPFHDMSGWFFSMVVLLSVNMLPVISYSNPAFTPFWMRLIPSYPILMAYRGAMFGGTVDFWPVALSIAYWCAVSFLLAVVFVQRKHLKGVKV